MVQIVPLALAKPRDEALARSPLRLVVFQIRFTPVETARDLRSGMSIQEGLGGADVWRLEPVQTQSFSVSTGPEGAPASAFDVSPNGWRLIAEEGGAAITLLPDSVNLETTAYPGWPTFRKIVDAILQTTAEVLRPEAEVRLALRYINRIDQPAIQTPQDWAGLIDANVLGVLSHKLGPSITAAQQQLQVKVGESEKATVQHGFIRDPVSNRLTYLMDFDTYRDGARPFTQESASQAIDSLHTAVLQIFQSFMTERLYEFLKSE